jgi:hypothetical protein
MIVAVIGSRQYPDLDRVRRYVRTLPIGTTVVSGGAKGVDSVAAQTARQCGLAVIEHLPDWKRYGKSAGMIRNWDIIRPADLVVAFIHNDSPGTKRSIEIAHELGKVVIINPEE